MYECVQDLKCMYVCMYVCIQDLKYMHMYVCMYVCMWKEISASSINVYA